MWNHRTKVEIALRNEEWGRVLDALFDEIYESEEKDNTWTSIYNKIVKQLNKQADKKRKEKKDAEVH